MTNAKPKSHWTNPRRSIATSLRHHDIAYATHGAMQGVQALRSLMGYMDGTALDYGCGTGRVGRVLTPAFKHVYGYDPVPETIAVGKHEADPLTFHNLTLTCNIDAVPEVDCALSVNVIEHLSDGDAREMLDNLIRKVRGDTVLWYHPIYNRCVLSPWLTDSNKREDDLAAKSGSTVVVRTFRFRG